MSLLQTVEQQLGGPIETWPSNIILLLFQEFPSPANIKQVAAFLYGNGVWESKVTNLYTTCYGDQSNYLVVYSLYET